MTSRGSTIRLIVVLSVVCVIAFLLLQGTESPDVGSAARDSTASADSTVEPPAKPMAVTRVALSGRVLDTTGKPVPGTSVSAFALTAEILAATGRTRWLAGEDAPFEIAEADADGAYAFPSLPAGRHGLLAAAPGHAGALVVVTVTQAPLTKDLLLVPDRSIRGRVVDAATGKPVLEAVVSAVRTVEKNRRRVTFGLGFLIQPRARTSTGKDGTFRLRGLMAGRYEVVAEKDGHARAIVFAEAGATDVRLALGAGVVLVGTVTAPDGTPLPGADIEVLLDHEMIEGEALADADGAFRIEGLRPGAKTVTARFPGRCPARLPGISVRAGAQTRLGIVLEEGLGLAGRVIDPAGAPIANATVTVFTSSGRVAAALARSDSDGAFACAAVPSGKILVYVEGPAYGKRTLLDIEPGTLDLEVVLQRTGTLRLRVGSNVTKGPIEAFWVKFYRIDEDADVTARTRWWTDPVQVPRAPGGKHMIPDLPPGRYVVEVGADEHAPREYGDVEVPSGRPSDELLAKLDAGAEITGRVVRDHDDAPVSGARIVLNVVIAGARALRTRGRPVKSGEDGAFRMSGLPDGPASLTITHPDHPGIVVLHEATAAGEGEPLVVRLPVAGAVEGRVIGQDGRPVVGSMLIIQPAGQPVLNRRTRANEKGDYRIEGLAPGPATVWWVYRTNPYETRMESIDVRAGETIRRDFDLSEEGASLSGTIRTATGPLKGARLNLIAVDVPGKDRADARNTLADAEGRFEFKGLAAGRYVLYGAEETSGAQRYIPVTVPEGGRVTTNIGFAAGRIEGRVVNSKGRGLAEAWVTVVRSEAAPGTADLGTLVNLRSWNETLTDGVFRCTGLSGGAYAILASHADHGSVRLEGISLGEGQRVTGFVIRLPPAASLVLDVSGPDGPPSRVTVQLFDPQGRATTPIARTLVTDRGRVTVPRIAAGTHRLTVRAQGHATTVLGDVVVAEQGVTTVPVRLVRGGTLRVRVLDGEGKPVAGASLRLERVDGGAIAGLIDRERLLTPPPRTGADGLAIVEHVTPGRYRIKARKTDRNWIAPEETLILDGVSTEICIETSK
jgi:protocatechuate 3,4-dioxygenase beta subunit